ncbi:transcription factor Adf-1-like isoform X2 [Harpegnathos saltator]|uniref:transcription factor Adf-1-like isoform X2 n=1 Tax=Harpegnathos saltator TaxID=610380 RepID=UPI000DBED8EE|nr:transcription factor Adf-1-like isoform X2 [Harpegnathos saltator]
MDYNVYFRSQYQEDEYLEDTQNKRNEIKVVENDPLLISLVYGHPYLYNNELTDFKDSMKKQNAWLEIANIMDMTTDECQSRWKRLRERYTRERKQRQEETTTGSLACKRKTFEFFNNMQFLERFVKRRRTFSSHNEQENNSSSVNVTAMIYNRNSPSLARSFNVQKNIRLHNKQEYNLATNIATVKKSSTKSSISSANISQHIDDSSHAWTKSVVGQRIKPEGKFQPDILKNAIGKVTSSSENTCVPFSQSSLKPEVEEDSAFCQLILSALNNMTKNMKIKKKKAILGLLYDV